MKLFTLNFLTCAVKSCKSGAAANPSSTDNSTTDSSGAAFPLHVREAELVRIPIDFNPLFWRNVLGRIEWDAMQAVLSECGLQLPDGLLKKDNNVPAAGAEGMDVDTEEQKKIEVADDVSDDVLQKLHVVLLETQVQEGKLVCGRCGFEYAVKEGIPNFLLPPHLV